MDYLNELAIESVNTKNEYQRDIEQFFQLTRNKVLGELTEKDLKFSNTEMKRYKSILSEQYKPSTLNRKLSAVKSLFTELSKEYESINISVFSVKKVKANVNSSGVLYWDEVSMMIKLLDNSYKESNKEKSIMIELAARTSIRLSALMGIKMCDINKPRNKDYYVVRVIDKGKKVDEKPIPESLYVKIVSLKRGFEDNVFTLAKRTFQRTIEDLCNEFGIDSSKNGRNISFHSLKKLGTQWVLENTGSVPLAAMQGNHSNIQTTYNHYLDLERINQMEHLAGLNIDKELDESVLEDMSKDELMELIKNIGGSAKRQLIIEAQKQTTK